MPGMETSKTPPRAPPQWLKHEPEIPSGALMAQFSTVHKKCEKRVDTMAWLCYTMYLE